MVLGLNRSRLRSDASGLFTNLIAPIKLVQAGDWASARGAVLFESSADLIGVFPGYAERGCRLESVRLTITDTFLLIDEGQPNGFGLPLRWIEGSALVQQPGRSDGALRIFYRESGSPRCFTIRFGASRLGSRGVGRSTRVQQALHSTGLLDRFAAEAPLEPSFTLPWDQTREFESENAIWTGRANAPIRVGAENIPSDVWLTTKSLIWGGSAGDGLNRIPLTLLMDMVSTRLRDREGTPVIYIAIGDARTGRFELPFVFDLHTPPDRNFRERGAFLVGLRSRGLPDGKAAPSWQPWRADSGPRTISVDEAAFALDTAATAPGLDESLGSDSPESVADNGQGLAHDTLLRIKQNGWPPRPLDGPAETPISETATKMQTGDDEVVGSPATIESRAEIAALNSEIDVGGPGVTESESLSDTEFAAIVPHAEERNDPLIVGLEDSLFDEMVSPTKAFGAELTSAGQETTDLVDQSPSVHDESHSAIFEAALSEVEVEKDPADCFLALVSNPDAATARSEDVVLAEWPSADETAIELDMEHDRLIAATIEDGQNMPVDFEVNPTKKVDEDPWVVVRRYEEMAIGALAEALRVIDERFAGNSVPRLSETAPSSWEQAQAVSETANLVAQEVVSAEDARVRRERLLALGDVSVRLRTLVELFDGGYLSTEELDSKRSKLVKQLSQALIP